MPTDDSTENVFHSLWCTTCGEKVDSFDELVDVERRKTFGTRTEELGACPNCLHTTFQATETDGKLSYRFFRKLGVAT